MDFPFKRLTTQPGGVRAAIALLVTIPVLVPLFAALLIWMGERDSTSAANDRVVAAARSAAVNVRELVETTQERLEQLDEALGASLQRFRPPRSTVEEGFVALYDAEGLTVGADGTRSASIVDNADFQALAAGTPWVITPLLGNAGSLRIFGVGRRIERDGQFAGAITIYLPGDALSGAWSEAAMGAQSAIGVIRSDGWLVTRYPLPDRTLDLSGTQLFQSVSEAPEGTFDSPSSPVDAVPRRVGYVSLPDLGLVVTASMSSTPTTEAFWSRVGYTALVAAPVFIAMVFLCGWAITLLMRQERNRMELEAALARNQVLFKEIHHRVKNNLQQVSAMIRLQQAPAAMKEDLTRRITAMSAVHQHIYESDQFGVLDAEAYLARVLAGLRDTAPPGVTLEWKLAPLQLSPDQALPLGMIVNETVSNAFKHGFPEGRSGAVKVTLERPLEGNEAVLTVADNGVGMAETPAGGIGLGTRLISGLAQQLGGKTTVIRDSGVRTELRFPVDLSKTP